jgi:hypothetical protein
MFTGTLRFAIWQRAGHAVLLEAAERGDSGCSKQLVLAPAAEELDSTQVAQLLTAAVQQSTVECIDQLCRLPASQQVSREEVAGLLLAAVHHWCYYQQQLSLTAEM